MSRLLLLAVLALLALLTACAQPETRADRYQKCVAQDQVATVHPFGKIVCARRLPA